MDKTQYVVKPLKHVILIYLFIKLNYSTLCDKYKTSGTTADRFRGSVQRCVKPELLVAQESCVVVYPVVISVMVNFTSTSGRAGL